MEIIASDGRHPYLTADYFRHTQRRSLLDLVGKVSALRFFSREENQVNETHVGLRQTRLASRLARRGFERGARSRFGQRQFELFLRPTVETT
jgi:hypothetical protein